MEYVPTIGLEIHAELLTKTKMFCTSKNDTKETRPNVNICPVCMGHPGTLPVINREAVRQVLRVGTALGGECADYTEFDRKNYFYPDLPKGYQLSQYEFPLIKGGSLKGITLTRIHLEEDTARSIHNDDEGETLIDYNRAGVPLMELVTEPEMHSAAEAGKFARELQLVLRYLGASRADMEKGEMRVEANVSVAEAGKRASAYVEIKNLNSFKIMERAVAYEIERQKKVLTEGGAITKETLGWDEKRQMTFPQRSKEGAADYRYFPDPDLPSLRLSEIESFVFAKIQESLPEMPEGRRGRYQALGIKVEDSEQYVATPTLAIFFDEVIEGLGGDRESIQLASNYIANDLVNLIRDIEGRDTSLMDRIPLNSSSFIDLISMLSKQEISSRVAKDILAIMVETSSEPRAIAMERKLFNQDSASDIASQISEILARHATVVEEYRAGKEQALQFLIGQIMKVTRGAGDPRIIRAKILEHIGKV